MDRLEGDADEWRRLSHSDMESSINEQLAHLAAQMHEPISPLKKLPKQFLLI